MRRIFGILGVAIVLLAIATPAVAQENSGAVIVRGEGLGFIWEWDGENLLIGMSTYSDFLCSDAEVVGFPFQVVTTPVGTAHLTQNGPLFARVWYGTPDDINPEFICGTDPIAEGIIQGHFQDNDLDVVGPGSNVWGHVFNGTLYDLDGLCMNGMVELNVVHKWRISPQGEGHPRVLKGPDLTCAE